MAKLSKINGAQNKRNRVIAALKAGKKPPFPTRVYNRCSLCGRVGGYMRDFRRCRICFRELANDGALMGVKRSSW